MTHLEIQDLDSEIHEDGHQVLDSSSDDSDNGNDDRHRSYAVACDVHVSARSSISSSSSSPKEERHRLGMTSSNTPMMSSYRSSCSLNHNAVEDFEQLEQLPYDLASMSMYDITHTSPVQTVQRRVSIVSSAVNGGPPCHSLYVSMPDMTKAAFVIPDIDELLTNSSASGGEYSSDELYYSPGRYVYSSSSTLDSYRGGANRTDEL